MANIQTNSLKFPGLDDIYQFNKVTNIAPAYDSTKTYAVGDLCSKDNVVYKCSTAITTAEAWTAGHWTQVSLGEEIASVKQDLQELDTALDTKANIDGSYDTMTVGNAKQLVSTVNIEDKAPYLFRTSGGSADIGDREYDTLVGGSVAWNQIVPSDKKSYTNTDTDSREYINMVLQQASSPYTAYFNIYEISTAKAINRVLNIATASNGLTLIHNGQSKNLIIANLSTVNFVSGHKYLFHIDVLSADPTTIGGLETDNLQIFDLTQMFGSTIADYVYGLESATAGTGIAWLKKYGFFTKDYYAYDPGSIKSVGSLVSHDCVGFNAWDEEWELGTYSTSDGSSVSASNSIRGKNPIMCVPNTTYYFKTTNGISGGNVYLYDANDTFIRCITAYGNHTFTTPDNAQYFRISMGTSYGTTYNHDICINLSWDGERNGEYEAYTKHSYPLDSDLTLRGIPKLDASNNLYYDGDTYEADGTVTRKYGIVDLGTLNWAATNDERINTGKYFQASISGAKANGFNGITNRYPIYSNVGLTALISSVGASVDKIAWTLSNTIYVIDSAYTDATTFKTSLSGVYLVYELATPTTEEADPFQSPQIVDDFGTEEYVLANDAFPMPVGHVTQYQPNLRAKVEMSPNSPDGDGDYMVRQTNGQNEYVEYTSPVPADPTEDGTYVLKLTKSGSTVTKTWVAET